MTDRDRVAHALQTERDGNDFYDRVSAHAAHKLTRAAFVMLSKEESRHIDTIESLAKFLDGDADAPEIDSSPTLESLEKTIHTIYSIASAEDLDGDMDPAEAYTTAIDLEERSTALYKQCALECDTAEGRHLFDVLSREELDHLKLLEDMQGYLTDPEQWFVDRKMILREDD